MPLWGSPPEHLGTSVPDMDYEQNLSRSENVRSCTPAVVCQFQRPCCTRKQLDVETEYQSEEAYGIRSHSDLSRSSSCSVPHLTHPSSGVNTY